MWIHLPSLSVSLYAPPLYEHNSHVIDDGSKPDSHASQSLFGKRGKRGQHERNTKEGKRK